MELNGKVAENIVSYESWVSVETENSAMYSLQPEVCYHLKIVSDLQIYTYFCNESRKGITETRA